jgi:hypothetical protein
LRLKVTQHNRGLLKEIDVADTAKVPVPVTTDSSVWNLVSLCHL